MKRHAYIAYIATSKDTVSTNDTKMNCMLVAIKFKHLKIKPYNK